MKWVFSKCKIVYVINWFWKLICGLVFDDCVINDLLFYKYLNFLKLVFLWVNVNFLCCLILVLGGYVFFFSWKVVCLSICLNVI